MARPLSRHLFPIALLCVVAGAGCNVARNGLAGLSQGDLDLLKAAPTPEPQAASGGSSASASDPEGTGAGPTPAGGPSVVPAEEPLGLAPTPAPVVLAPGSFGISALEPWVGGPGELVTIRGQDLGASSGKPVQVLLGGVLVAGVTREGDSAVRVRMPDSAKSGDVSVLVGGAPSNALPFRVLAGLRVAGSSQMRLGTKAVFKAHGTTDTNEAVEGLSVAWQANGTAVTVDRGRVSAVGPGDSILTIMSGLLTASWNVHVFRIDAVDLSSSSVELVAAASDGSSPSPGLPTSVQLVARVRASDEASMTRQVAWSVADPAVATVEAGLVRAQALSATASTTLTAISVDDPSVAATASIRVRPEAGLDVVVD